MKAGSFQLQAQNLYSAILNVSSSLKRITFVLGNTFIKAAYSVSRTGSLIVNWAPASELVCVSPWELGVAAEPLLPH